MTNTSMTFGRPTRLTLPQPASLLASIGAALGKFNNWLLGEQYRTPKNVAELLAHADSLEATQPSFAADLRSVALRAQGITKA